MALKRIKYSVNDVMQGTSSCSNPTITFDVPTCMNVLCREDNFIEVEFDPAGSCNCIDVTVICDDCLSCDPVTVTKCFCDDVNDCPACHTCVNGECEKVCDDSKICDAGTNNCVDCLLNDDCPNNQECFNGDCVCPDGKLRDQFDMCVDCLNDNNCSDCEVCVGGSCQPKCQKECLDGTCVDCLESSDCGVNQVCNGNSCECAPGYELDANGNCVVAGDCDNDTQCGPCQVCSNGDCVDLNCPPGYVKTNDPNNCCAKECDCDSGACNDGSPCVSADGTNCYCSPCSGDCENNGDCGPGCACVNGKCESNPCADTSCVTSGDCADGCGCDNGECTPCASLDCDQCGLVQGCECVNGNCQDTGTDCNEPCPNGDECGAGCGCEDSVCVDCSNTECVDNDDCPYGCSCENGLCNDSSDSCEATSCETGADCGPNCGCDEGECVPCSTITNCQDCDDTNGCGCVNGQCEPKDEDCEDVLKVEAIDCDLKGILENNQSCGCEETTLDVSAVRAYNVDNETQKLDFEGVLSRAGELISASNIENKLPFQGKYVLTVTTKAIEIDEDSNIVAGSYDEISQDVELDFANNHTVAVSVDNVKRIGIEYTSGSKTFRVFENSAKFEQTVDLRFYDECDYNMLTRSLFSFNVDGASVIPASTNIILSKLTFDKVPTFKWFSRTGSTDTLIKEVYATRVGSRFEDILSYANGLRYGQFIYLESNCTCENNRVPFACDGGDVATPVSFNVPSGFSAEESNASVWNGYKGCNLMLKVGPTSNVCQLMAEAPYYIKLNDRIILDEDAVGGVINANDFMDGGQLFGANKGNEFNIFLPELSSSVPDITSTSTVDALNPQQIKTVEFGIDGDACYVPKVVALEQPEECCTGDSTRFFFNSNTFPNTSGSFTDAGECGSYTVRMSEYVPANGGGISLSAAGVSTSHTGAWYMDAPITDGKIEFFIDGETTAFKTVNYTGSEQAFRLDLEAGSYSVVYTKANGCQFTETFDIADCCKILGENGSDFPVGSVSVDCTSATATSFDIDGLPVVNELVGLTYKHFIKSTLVSTSYSFEIDGADITALHGSSTPISITGLPYIDGTFEYVVEAYQGADTAPCTTWTSTFFVDCATSCGVSIEPVFYTVDPIHAHDGMFSGGVQFDIVLDSEFESNLVNGDTFNVQFDVVVDGSTVFASRPEAQNGNPYTSGGQSIQITYATGVSRYKYGEINTTDYVYQIEGSTLPSVPMVINRRVDNLPAAFTNSSCSWSSANHTANLRFAESQYDCDAGELNVSVYAGSFGAGSAITQGDAFIQLYDAAGAPVGSPEVFATTGNVATVNYTKAVAEQGYRFWIYVGASAPTDAIYAPTPGSSNLGIYFGYIGVDGLSGDLRQNSLIQDGVAGNDAIDIDACGLVGPTVSVNTSCNSQNNVIEVLYENDDALFTGPFWFIDNAKGYYGFYSTFAAAEAVSGNSAAVSSYVLGSDTYYYITSGANQSGFAIDVNSNVANEAFANLVNVVNNRHVSVQSSNWDTITITDNAYNVIEQFNNLTWGAVAQTLNLTSALYPDGTYFVNKPTTGSVFSADTKVAEFTVSCGSAASLVFDYDCNSGLSITDGGVEIPDGTNLTFKGVATTYGAAKGFQQATEGTNVLSMVYGGVNYNEKIGNTTSGGENVVQCNNIQVRINETNPSQCLMDTTILNLSVNNTSVTGESYDLYLNRGTVSNPILTALGSVSANSGAFQNVTVPTLVAGETYIIEAYQTDKVPANDQYKGSDSFTQSNEGSGCAGFDVQVFNRQTNYADALDSDFVFNIQETTSCGWSIDSVTLNVIQGNVTSYTATGYQQETPPVQALEGDWLFGYEEWASKVSCSTTSNCNKEGLNAGSYMVYGLSGFSGFEFVIQASNSGGCSTTITKRLNSIQSEDCPSCIGYLVEPDNFVSGVPSIGTISSTYTTADGYSQAVITIPADRMDADKTTVIVGTPSGSQLVVSPEIDSFNNQATATVIVEQAAGLMTFNITVADSGGVSTATHDITFV